MHCFYFFQKFYIKSLTNHYLFFQNIFKKKIPFFVLSNNHFFLKMFAFPLFLYQSTFFKKKFWGWLLLYNLVKFKTPIWIKYIYFILKRNKVRVIVSVLGDTQQSWLKFLRRKNFVLVGPTNPKLYNDLFDFPFFAPEFLNDFYIFFIFDLFLKNSKKNLYKFVYFFFNLKKLILKKKWLLLN